MKTFTKFGSCVTSDCFNFMDINQLYPSYTHTGIPISNILDEANINILEEDIIADNFFWKKMLQTIFKHEPFSKYLENRQSDYFIFDLADERLPLQECVMENFKDWMVFRAVSHKLTSPPLCATMLLKSHV